MARRIGAAGVAWLVVSELAAQGHQVDCFVVRAPSNSPHRQDEEEQPEHEGLRFLRRESGWQWNRWYGKINVSRMISAQLAEGVARYRLAQDLMKAHRKRPYDVVYQYSAIESFGFSQPRLAELPPLVIHPSVHAAGELRWLRAERDLVHPSQGTLRPAVVRAWLRIRSSQQRRSIGRARGVLATAERFGELLEEDYGVDHRRVSVVPCAIDVERFRPSAVPPEPIGPARIAVVGRVVVRKGVEHIVELSHRLADLSGQISIEVVGNNSQWSDYRPLLDDLHPKTARFIGPMSREQLATWLPTCDLLIQPSKYEPFGLTVAEALACGVPVVATTEVGATEDVDEHCATRVPPSDPAALERAVRSMLERMRSPEMPALRALARCEAERLWSPARIGRLTAAALDRVDP